MNPSFSIPRANVVQSLIIPQRWNDEYWTGAWDDTGHSDPTNEEMRWGAEIKGTSASDSPNTFHLSQEVAKTFASSGSNFGQLSFQLAIPQVYDEDPFQADDQANLGTIPSIDLSLDPAEPSVGIQIVIPFGAYEPDGCQISMTFAVRENMLHDILVCVDHIRSDGNFVCNVP